jgi:hypothetical protein
VLRREERAAVGVRLDGDLERAEGVRLLGDLELVHADERPQDRHARRLVDAGEVCERLRRHLAQALAGDQRGRARVPGQALRDADHEAAVDHHPGRRGHREHDLALDLPEWHQEQAREVLPLGEAGHQLAHLAAREVREVRGAVEVHEDHPAAALHEPPRRHRGVDAARDQRGHRAARAHRQSARPRVPLGVDEGFARQHLDPHVALRVLEAHPRVGPQREHVRAELPVQLHRGQRKRLERAPRRDAERAEGAPLDGPLHRGAEGLERGPGTQGQREVGDAEHAGQTLAQPLGIRVTGEIEHEPPGQLHQAHRPQVADRSQDVSVEVAEEERAIATLEADLVVVDDRGGRGHWRSTARGCLGRRR